MIKLSIPELSNKPIKYFVKEVHGMVAGAPSKPMAHKGFEKAADAILLVGAMNGSQLWIKTANTTPVLLTGAKYALVAGYVRKALHQ